MLDKFCSDTEGLNYLRWSQFDSPDKVDSGYHYMERQPVLVLDDIIREYRFNLDIQLGYVSEAYAKKIGLPMLDSHRIGRAIKIRILNPQKRLKLVSALLYRGITRIAVSIDTVYFDTDDLKIDALLVWS